MLPVRTLALAVGVASLAASLAACTGGEPPAQPSASSAASVAFPDACSLLTAEQLEAATGHEFAPGTLSEDSNGIDTSQCDWVTADGSEFPTAIVSISEADFTVAEQREAANSFYGSTADADVPGGVEPFVTQGGQHVGMNVGPYWVMVTFAEDSTDDLTVQTTELARAVASALAP